MPDTNGWSKYELLVMDKLETLTRTSEEQNEKLGIIEVKLAVQETKVKWIATGASVVISSIFNLVLFLVRWGG